MKSYKANKKYIKCIDKEVVSVGFPDSALAGIVGSKLLSRTDKMAVLICDEIKDRVHSKKSLPCF